MFLHLTCFKNIRLEVFVLLVFSVLWLFFRFKNNLPLPLQSPCEFTLDNISTADAAKLFTAHEKLVRCMVPPEKLLDAMLNKLCAF